MLVSQQACVNATKEIHELIFWYELCNVIINKYVQLYVYMRHCK